jgi:hypothetical protein
MAVTISANSSVGALASQPDSLNFLSPLGFRLTINRIPNVIYYCQAVTLPEMSIDELESQTPFVALKNPGSKLRFGPVVIRFRVNENMRNYIEIYNWLHALGRPDSFQQTLDWATSQDSPKTSKTSEIINQLSDGTLSVLTSANNPSIRIKFLDMFPTSLTALDFDATLTDVEYLEASVQFAYRKYEIEVL